ncbi:diguanylate cyclase [Demequina sp. SO4-18]|uniref:GGDEF domain-containing protein n=1 Tax=Demequina sp. SO4-18 TaxID=3401026 RepID=UPI003B5C8BC9
MSSRTRIPRQLGARGYTIASSLIALAVLVQLAVIVVASTFASQQVDAAAADTYEYVADLTVESVARYAASGRDMVDDTALSLRFGDEPDRADLMEAMAERLTRTDNVRTLYVGWPDGRFLALSRSEDGFRSQWIAAGSGEETVRFYDEDLVLLSGATEPSDYDAPARPWFVAAAASAEGVWTAPYLDYGNPTTLVSPAAAVREDGELVAVVGADLDLQTLRSILDDLPYGEGAEAFVLTGSSQVIGAPDRYTAQLEALAEQAGGVPTAEDLGLPVASEVLDRGESAWSTANNRMVVDRSLPASESVDWQVHLTADASQLSAGLGNIGAALWWVSGLSLAASGIAAVVVWNVSHSVRRMRVRASTDQLTGLANRHEYERAGKDMLLQASVRGERVLAVVLDLDGFKALNDELGHDVGDAALAATGEALRESVRGDDVAARLGGDEFVVLQPLGAREDAHVIVERIRERVENRLGWLPLGDTSVGVTAGYALSKPGMDLRGLVMAADVALVDGKRSEKGMAHRG